jgi:hypothetical protein
MYPLKTALQRRGVQARKKLLALQYYLKAQNLAGGGQFKSPPHEVPEPHLNHIKVPEGTLDMYDAITTEYSDDQWFQDEEHTANYALYFGTPKQSNLLCPICQASSYPSGRGLCLTDVRTHRNHQNKEASSTPLMVA